MRNQGELPSSSQSFLQSPFRIRQNSARSSTCPHTASMNSRYPTPAYARARTWRSLRASARSKYPRGRPGRSPGLSRAERCRPPQVEIVGLQIGGGPVQQRLAAQLEFQGFDDGLRDFILNREHVEVISRS